MRMWNCKRKRKGIANKDEKNGIRCE